MRAGAVPVQFFFSCGRRAGGAILHCQKSANARSVQSMETDLDVLVLRKKRRAFRRWKMRVQAKRRRSCRKNFAPNGSADMLPGGANSYAAKENARLREQPKSCSCFMCGNPRRFKFYTYWVSFVNGGNVVRRLRRKRYIAAKDRLTRAEQRSLLNFREQLWEAVWWEGYDI